MAGRATTPTAFPLFSTLAPELRNQIWQDALPDEGGPALVLYKTGCWQPHGVEPNLHLEFHHEWLEAARLEFPLAFVNREAHSIAVAWFRKQRRFTIRSHQGRDPMLVRPMDPAADALYVDPSQWESFYIDAFDRAMEPDVLNRTYSTQSSVQRIALPEALVRSRMAEIPEWIEPMASLRELLVVVNTPPSLPPESDYVGSSQPRWEFIGTGGDVFYWNANDRRFTLCSGREPIGDGVVSRLVEGSNEVVEAFADAFNPNHTRSFIIQPILAVQRQTRA